ncbi:MAG: histidine kinase [Eubacterium sp.]|nr:histidine kinase [Eubacterium sp.]
MKYATETSLLFCGMASFILLLGFYRKELSDRRNRLFFYMLVVSVIMFVSSAFLFFVQIGSGRGLEVVIQIIVYSSFYLLLFLYTLYLLEIVQHAPTQVYADSSYRKSSRRKNSRRESSYRKRLFRKISHSKSSHTKTEKRRQMLIDIVRVTVAATCITTDTFWIFSAFHDNEIVTIEENVVRGRFYFFGQAGGLIILLIDMLVLLLFRKRVGIKRMLTLLTLPAFPLLMALLEYFIDGLYIRNQAIFLSLLIIYTRYHLETTRELEEAENALVRSKVDLMTGRMRPHYIYNVLTTIYYLCEEDPAKAQEAISIFSNYMNDTLEALQSRELVPLCHERKTIRNYLALEKIRYGDQLKIVHHSEVDEEQIKIPPLSVQPLVENAVRHGFSEKNDVVTVQIEAIQAAPDMVEIHVHDNGAGYEPEQIQPGEGLYNVRERIRLQCGGTLTMESAPGQGTTAVLRIPAQPQ